MHRVKLIFGKNCFTFTDCPTLELARDFLSRYSGDNVQFEIHHDGTMVEKGNVDTYAKPGKRRLSKGRAVAKPTLCLKCGAMCESAAAAQIHCAGSQHGYLKGGRPKQKRSCLKCGALCEGAREAAAHCRGK